MLIRSMSSVEGRYLTDNKLILSGGLIIATGKYSLVKVKETLRAKRF